MLSSQMHELTVTAAICRYRQAGEPWFSGSVPQCTGGPKPEPFALLLPPFHTLPHFHTWLSSRKVVQELRGRW